MLCRLYFPFEFFSQYSANDDDILKTELDERAEKVQLVQQQKPPDEVAGTYAR